MTLTWITSKSHGATQDDTVHLEVNGQKTNIWYRLPTYKYYTDTRERQKAELEASWIMQGLIKPRSGDWTRFDTCDFVDIVIKDLEVVKNTTYANHIESTTGYETDKYTTPEGQTAIIKEHIGRRIFTQYIKMIIGDTISTKIGISFHHYGYDLAFIP